MAIYHLNARGCSPCHRRGRGHARPPTSRGRRSWRSGRARLCDYARKERVTWPRALPCPPPRRPSTAATLWNEAERVWAEGGRRQGRSWPSASSSRCPIELDERRAARACVRDFCALFPAKACDWAIHDDAPSGGNPHAHVLVSALDLRRGRLRAARQGRRRASACTSCERERRRTVCAVRATEWAVGQGRGLAKAVQLRGRPAPDHEAGRERRALAPRTGSARAPCKMHRRRGAAAPARWSREELVEVRAAWAKHREQAPGGARPRRRAPRPQAIDHRSNKDRGSGRGNRPIHEGGVGADRARRPREARTRKSKPGTSACASCALS